MKRIKPALLITVIMMLLILGGCANKSAESATAGVEPMYKTLDELHGKSVSVMSGSSQEMMVKEKLPDCKIMYYPTFSECFMAAQQGKVDFSIAPKTAFQGVSESFPDLTWQDEPFFTSDVFCGIAKSEFGEKLVEQMNEFLKERWDSGEQEEMLNRYYDDAQYGEVYDYSALGGENGTVRFTLHPLDAPYFRRVENGYKGVEAELLYLFCERYGYDVDISITEFGSTLLGISTGRYDMTAYLVYTEERAEKMLFSNRYTYSDQIILVRNTGGSVEGKQGLWELIKGGFEKNFLRENRWKMVLSGLGVTLELALGAALFGTLFGALLCAMRMNDRKVLCNLTACFIRLIQGIPVLVLLLVLYYVIFGKSSVSGVVVGIFAFSIDFGVYVAEILRSAIEAVNYGQWEAAYALGFSGVLGFMKVILPQALKHALPVYKGQFVSMVKMTSVIGYVAVQDLTKVSDIIRSQTYDAIFPLFVTALIYFLLSGILIRFLDAVELKIDPAHRKNVLSDVNMDVTITEKDKEPTYPDTNEVIIRLEHLRKEYEIVTPLEDVNGEVRRGDVIAVIGPSGTGKSTLLRCINHMEEPTSGTVELFGTVPKSSRAMNQLRMRVGMVFQSFNLFEHLTVIENIMLAPVTLRGTSRQEAYENGIALLRRVGLAEKALCYPEELSGGQKQRVAIVRALAMDPEALLLDEPTSALDPTMVGEVLQVISQLSESGLTMMIVTHEMQFARKVSNRVFYMDEGRIYEDGETSQVFENPKGERTRLFIRHLQQYRKTMESAYFDFAGLRSELEAFCQHQLINRRTTFNLLHCMEELLTQGLAVQGENAFPAEFTVEYGQDGSLTVYLRYKGEATDLMHSLDPVADSIVHAAVENSAHTWTPGEGNLMELCIKDVPC